MITPKEQMLNEIDIRDLLLRRTYGQLLFAVRYSFHLLGKGCHRALVPGDYIEVRLIGVTSFSIIRAPRSKCGIFRYDEIVGMLDGLELVALGEKK